MRANTVIHMLAGERVRTPLTLEQMHELIGRSNAINGGGIVRLEHVTGHGVVRHALIPMSAVVWFEDLREAPAGS